MVFVLPLTLSEQKTIEELVKVKMPKKSGRWWFSRRRKDMDANQVDRPITTGLGLAVVLHTHGHEQ